MEPNWTKQIQSETICNFFYIFFVIYAAFLALSALALGYTLFNLKKMGAAGFGLGLQATLMMGLAATMMLFHYLICDRALLSGRTAGTKMEQFVGKH